jgi:hypothetical protein
VHGRAVPGHGFLDDAGPELPGDLGGGVGRAVVDDHDGEARRNGGQQGAQRGRLVAARKHQVAVFLHAVHARKQRASMVLSNPYEAVTSSAGVPGDRARHT